MTPDDNSARIDRHALVMSIWLPTGFVALALFHYGFGAGGPLWVAFGFAAILVGFVVHVIVNTVLGTGFSTGEVALSLALSFAAVIAFVLATLFSTSFAERNFLVVIGGLATLAAAIVFYMVTRAGTRGAFESFDIIRNNHPRQSARLPHRGGRR
jgi:hypothetical protein